MNSNIKYQLLLVTQNEIYKDMIQTLLEGHDIEVSISKSYKDTLTMLDENAVSILQVDSLSNQEDDSKFIEDIRSKILFQDKPIIMFVESLKYSFKIAGVSSFLTKPLFDKKVHSTIIESLQKHYEQDILIKELFSQTQAHKEELTLMKDRMLLIFTHELKTPLNAIINFADHINRGLQKPLSRKKVDRFTELSEIIKINGEVLLNEINTLLDIAKIKEQRMVFNKESISLTEIISHLVHNYRLLYNKEVIDNIDDVTIVSDKKSIIHVFENLYSNALKYSRSKVEITLNEDDERFVLTIEDDGLGIEESQREKIFEIFEQTDETVLTREKEGTGIGLYIVKLLSEQFDYKVEVSTSYLGGAKFSITGKKE